MSSTTSSFPRKKLSELRTLYELEPKLRDIYVEGVFDKAFYSWYLEETGKSSTSVYDIDAVDVGQEVLEKYKLTGGNRDRVVALAFELDEVFPEALPYVICIVDKDFDAIEQDGVRAEHLLKTDYTSMEMYTWNRSTFRKVFKLGFGLGSIDADGISEQMGDILREVFVMRAANHRLGWGLAVKRVTRNCSLDGGTLQLDRDALLRKTLSRASRWKDRKLFEDVCEELAAVTLRDVRDGMHGGDYVEILGWILLKKLKWKGYREGSKAAAPILLAACEVEVLKKEGLFMRLDEIYG